MKLWEHETEERLVFYPAANPKSDAAVVIFPGGAYAFLADHEGRGYAEFLNEKGFHAFVCLYRVDPHRFPLPLLDARRAMRLVRRGAADFGINPRKIAAMGSSAGGSLVTLLATCLDPLPGENADDLRAIPFLPDLQILCYPVVTLADDAVTDPGSRSHLFGSNLAAARAVSPELHVTPQTPPAFLWHTADDPAVSVRNSLLYAAALHRAGVDVECHIFPHGDHGLGLAQNDPTVSAWTDLLMMRLSKM